jgi:hypothetical protein
MTLKVYVASSWRNQSYAGITQSIRENGHAVLDWRVSTPAFIGHRARRCRTTSLRSRSMRTSMQRTGTTETQSTHATSSFYSIHAEARRISKPVMHPVAASL